MELSNKTTEIIDALFSVKEAEIIESTLLEKCSTNIPGCEDWSQENMERVWLSVLKLSSGNIEKFESAIILANTDYRDLFMAAGFGDDLEAHKQWQP